MKKIALSLMTIAVVVTFAVGATSAYYTDNEVISGNTFSTGTVDIGSLANTHIVVTNLAPGAWRSYDVNVPYVGSLNADLYAGARGCSYPNDSTYLANSVNMEVYDKASGVRLFKGTAQQFSTEWVGIGTNIPQWTTMQYTMWFQLDPSFTRQGVTNTDTEIIVHAVQTGQTEFPANMPYETMQQKAVLALFTRPLLHNPVSLVASNFGATNGD